jgi:trimeric autotransporter adhesin
MRPTCTFRTPSTTMRVMSSILLMRNISWAEAPAFNQVCDTRDSDSAVARPFSAMLAACPAASRAEASCLISAGITTSLCKRTASSSRRTASSACMAVACAASAPASARSSIALASASSSAATRRISLRRWAITRSASASATLARISAAAASLAASLRALDSAISASLMTAAICPRPIESR